MGSLQSNIEKNHVIANCNCSAPEILRLVGLEDHLFPYIQLKTEPLPKLKLISNIYEFNSMLKSNMSLSPRMYPISNLENEILKGVEDPEQRLYRALRESKCMRTIVSDFKSFNGELYLCRQFIIEISSNIMAFKNLKVIQICCNYITELPKEIGMLKNLNILVLSRNRIKRLPKEIGQLTNLKELNLSQNHLTDLPLEISSLKNLEMLSLDSNKFREIPTVIGKLTSLKHLSIGNNPITDIPIEIINLSELCELLAENCLFSKLKNYKKNSKPKRQQVSQLKEICCRKIVQENIKINRNLLNYVKKYIVEVKECSYCNGPYFNNCVKVITHINTHGQDIPVSHKMCQYHFTTDKERKDKLMTITEKTTPFKRFNKNLNSIGEMFNRYLYKKNIKKKTNDKLVPLYYLAFDDYDL